MSRTLRLLPLILENPFPAVKLPTRMIWTSSSLKLFRRCKRKFFWKYMMRIRPKWRDTALMIGSGFHAGLAEWYKSRRSKMPKIAARFASELWEEAKVNKDFYDQDEYDKLSASIETLTGMLSGYADIYDSDRQRWIIDRDGIEAKFLVDCGTFDFSGKVDLLATDKRKKTSRKFLVEHKTASKIDSSYLERLTMDTQVRAYIFGAWFGLDEKVDQVLYDVVRKTSLRRKSNETSDEYNARIALDYASRPEFYFFREPLRFGKSDLASFEFEMRQTHQEYQAIIDGQFGDPTDPRSWGPDDSECRAFFRTCPNFQLCSKGLDAGTGHIFEYNDELHEELVEEE